MKARGRQRGFGGKGEGERSVCKDEGNKRRGKANKRPAGGGESARYTRI